MWRFEDVTRTGSSVRGEQVGVWECQAPEQPSAHPELASPQATFSLGWGRTRPARPAPSPPQQPEQDGVCFLFVGDACKPSGQENKIRKKKKN